MIYWPRSGKNLQDHFTHFIFQVGKPGAECHFVDGSHNLVGITRKRTLDPNDESNAFSLSSILLDCIGCMMIQVSTLWNIFKQTLDATEK